MLRDKVFGFGTCRVGGAGVGVLRSVRLRDVHVVRVPVMRENVRVEVELWMV